MTPLGLLVLVLAAPPPAAEIPFAPPQTPFTTLAGPQALVAGDVDRDGDPNLVVAWRTDGVIAWVRNDGPAGLTWHQTITATAAGVTGPGRSRR